MERTLRTVLSVGGVAAIAGGSAALAWREMHKGGEAPPEMQRNVRLLAEAMGMERGTAGGAGAIRVLLNPRASAFSGGFGLGLPGPLAGADPPPFISLPRMAFLPPSAYSRVEVSGAHVGEGDKEFEEILRKIVAPSPASLLFTTLHELAHLKHRDPLEMLGVSSLAYLAALHLLLLPSPRSPLPLALSRLPPLLRLPARSLAIVCGVALLGKMISSAIYYREVRADRTAASLSPEATRGALEFFETRLRYGQYMEHRESVAGALRRHLLALFGTHPPLPDRIAAVHALARENRERWQQEELNGTSLSNPFARPALSVR